MFGSELINPTVNILFERVIGFLKDQPLSKDKKSLINVAG